MNLRIILYLLLLSACSASTSDQLLENNIGFMHGQCLAIKANLANHENIVIIPVDSSQVDKDNNKQVGKIIKPASSDNECYMLLADRKTINIDQGYQFYQVQTDTPVNLAIALVSNVTNDNFQYAVCNSAEGMNFTVRQDDKLVWQGYYYLGYDITPTCKEK